MIVTSDGYIEREAVLNWIYELIEARQAWTSDARGEIQGLNAAVCAIEDIPAADVAPVRHGRWVKTIGENGVTSASRCNLCGFEDNRFSLFNYCPGCGALMDKDGDGDV